MIASGARWNGGGREGRGAWRERMRENEREERAGGRNRRTMRKGKEKSKIHGGSLDVDT